MKVYVVLINEGYLEIEGIFLNALEAWKCVQNYLKQCGCNDAWYSIRQMKLGSREYIEIDSQEGY